MRSAEEQAAWKASFLAAMRPTHDSIACVRRRQPETAVPAAPLAPVPAAPPPPPAPSPRPVLAAPPIAAELEFERVRAATCDRIARERETRLAEDAAVRMILNAYATVEPADRATSRGPQRGSAAGEAAADLILSLMPNRRS